MTETTAGRPDGRRLAWRWILPAAVALTLGCSLVEPGAANLASVTSVSATTASTATPTLDVPSVCLDGPLATRDPAAAFPASPTPEPNPTLSPSMQLEVMDGLVGLVERVYVEPTRLGEEWQAAVANLRERIGAGISADDFYSGLQSVIDVLGDEHSYLESPIDVAAADAALAGTTELVGIGVLAMAVPEAGLITLLQVYEGSPAARAGLRPHDKLLAIDELPVVEGGIPRPWLLRGAPCSVAVVKVASPGEPPREVAIVRQAYTVGQAIEARLLPDSGGARIGYVFLPSFFDERIPDQMVEALARFAPLDGLIIDNRMNGGGSSTVLEPVLGLLESGTLGDYVSRGGERPLQIALQDRYGSGSVPLVILIGGDTASYGEVFAGVLQNTGRARLVGARTAGNVETLHGYTFKDGSRLWIAEESFRASGLATTWEGVGVRPDVEVSAAWHTYTTENDPVIAAALELLRPK